MGALREVGWISIDTLAHGGIVQCGLTKAIYVGSLVKLGRNWSCGGEKGFDRR
jgi:hypothetical protein